MTKRKKGTLKQERVLQELPKNNYNMAKAMRKAGYKQSTTRSGDTYKRLRKHTQKLFKLSEITPEYVMGKLKRILEEGKVEANKVRCAELMAKYLGILKDKSDVNITQGLNYREIYKQLGDNTN